jgi:hypothetical protein
MCEFPGAVLEDAAVGLFLRSFPHVGEGVDAVFGIGVVWS